MKVCARYVAGHGDRMAHRIREYPLRGLGIATKTTLKPTKFIKCVDKRWFSFGQSQVSETDAETVGAGVEPATAT
jgi:hypothetical protein